jgi:hypothetical protein
MTADIGEEGMIKNIKFVLLTLTSLWCLCCFAQASPMDYWYVYCKDRYEAEFVALAVLDDQRCPWWKPKHREEWEPKYRKTICNSRYKIISVLHSTDSTFKKEFVEAKGIMLKPTYRHRPMLIFGYFKNGKIEIVGYEDPRRYLYRLSEDAYLVRTMDNSGYAYKIIHPIDVDALRAIGTPYYEHGKFDNLDKMYYNKFLMPIIKISVKHFAKKDVNELWQRLAQNRTEVKTTPINSRVAALGTIRGMRSVDDFDEIKYCEMDVAIEVVLKNEANAELSSPATMYQVGDCQPLKYLWNPGYLFGDVKDNRLVIDSLVLPYDVFVWGDTVYDISMGLPYEELFSYLLPSDISFSDLELERRFSHDGKSCFDDDNCKLPYPYKPIGTDDNTTIGDVYYVPVLGRAFMPAKNMLSVNQKKDVAEVIQKVHFREEPPYPYEKESRKMYDNKARSLFFLRNMPRYRCYRLDPAHPSLNFNPHPIDDKYFHNPQ